MLKHQNFDTTVSFYLYSAGRGPFYIPNERVSIAFHSLWALFVFRPSARDFLAIDVYMTSYRQSIALKLDESNGTKRYKLRYHPPEYGVQDFVIAPIVYEKILVLIRFLTPTTPTGIIIPFNVDGMHCVGV